MILYATKNTFERYKLKMPEEMSNPLVAAASRATIERESGDQLLEWGAKLFYFDRCKCIQVVNFASKLTFVLCDFKVDDIVNIGNVIAYYLLELYAGDRRMEYLIKHFLKEHPAAAFSRLTDRSIIATLNHTQTDRLLDGYRLYDYIRDGILHTRKLNRDINREWLFAQKIDGRKEYFFSAERFEELLKARYGSGS